MPLTLGDKYHPDFKGYPPHMSREDLELWEQFKRKHLLDATALYFDVGLGGLTVLEQEKNAFYADMWARNTQKRIDVLLEYPTKWVILELRKNAQASATGRLLMYRDMWRKERADARPVELWLVSDSDDPDLISLCKSLDIFYFTV